MGAESSAFNKVFGIGLSRTGTQSLAAALNHLGVLTIHFPHDETTFQQLRSGDFDLQVLRVYRGVCDTPVVPYYSQLDRLFANSRFILTVRKDKNAWLRSVEKLWRNVPEMEVEPFTQFINTAVYGTWGFSRDRFSYVYERHLAEVRRHFAGRPNDLLELDICAGEGWTSLASFLGMDAPPMAFPHEDVVPTQTPPATPLRS